MFHEYMWRKAILQIENAGNITRKPQENVRHEAQMHTRACTHTEKPLFSCFNTSAALYI